MGKLLCMGLFHFDPPGSDVSDNRLAALVYRHVLVLVIFCKRVDLYRLRASIWAA